MVNVPDGSAVVQRLRAQYVISDEDVYALVEEFMADPLTHEWDSDCFGEWFRDEVMGQFEPSEKRLHAIMAARGWTFDG